MKNSDDNLQWQDIQGASVPDTDDLQRRIILRAETTPQEAPLKKTLLSAIAKKTKAALQHHLAMPIGGTALAMSVALVFLMDGFLLREKEVLSTPTQMLAITEQVEIEDGMDWDTYFLLETEMVIAQL